MSGSVSTATVRLKPNRDKPVRQGHPWIFSGAIEHIPTAAVDGELVDVADAGGRWLGRGYLNRRSQIQVRLLTSEDRPIDDAFWRELAQGADRRAFKAKFSVVVVFYQHAVAAVGKVYKGLPTRGRKNAPCGVLVRGRNIHKGAAGCPVVRQVLQLARIHALCVGGNAFNRISRTCDYFHQPPVHGVFYQRQRTGLAEQACHKPEALRGPGCYHNLFRGGTQPAHAQ